MPTASRWGLILSLLLILGGCRYSYLPPIPRDITPEQPVRLTLMRDSRLQFRNQRLELIVRVQTLPQAGWLEVQFFDPFGTEIGSAAQYISSQDLGKLRYLYPPRTVTESGSYRAIVSFKGAIVRQFRVEIPTP